MFHKCLSICNSKPLVISAFSEFIIYVLTHEGGHALEHYIDTNKKPHTHTPMTALPALSALDIS